MSHFTMSGLVKALAVGLPLIASSLVALEASAAPQAPRAWQCAAGQNRVWVDSVDPAPVYLTTDKDANKLLGYYKYGVEMCQDVCYMSNGKFHIVNASANANTGQRPNGWIPQSYLGGTQIRC